jgi:hypothetical protein
METPKEDVKQAKHLQSRVWIRDIAHKPSSFLLRLQKALFGFMAGYSEVDPNEGAFLLTADCKNG